MDSVTSCPRDVLRPQIVAQRFAVFENANGLQEELRRLFTAQTQRDPNKLCRLPADRVICQFPCPPV